MKKILSFILFGISAYAVHAHENIYFGSSWLTPSEITIKAAISAADNKEFSFFKDAAEKGCGPDSMIFDPSEHPHCREVLKQLKITLAKYKEIEAASLQILVAQKQLEELIAKKEAEEANNQN